MDRPQHSQTKIDIFFEDNKLTLSRIADGSVSLLLQDPPFGETRNDWDIKPDLNEMWPLWKRVAKKNAAFVFFATQPFASELVMSNYDMFKYDCIWYKPKPSGHLNANRMPMRNHESILVFYKKLPTYNPQMSVAVRKKVKLKNDRNGTNYDTFSKKGGLYEHDNEGLKYPESIIDLSNGGSDESDHPTQKPISIIRYLIKTYSNEGDLVFDGYSGSGTTAVACFHEKRNCIASEKVESIYNKSIIRLNREMSTPELNLKS